MQRFYAASWKISSQKLMFNGTEMFQDDYEADNERNTFF